MNKKRKKLIRKITNNIQKVLIEDKIIILNRIAMRVGSDNVYEEGLGCRIMFDLINDVLLEEIDKLIYGYSNKTDINLDSDNDLRNID